jgi:hypothetical protein
MTLAHITSTTSTRPSTRHSDLINLLPPTTHLIPCKEEESLSEREVQVPEPVHHRTIFSAFRTHITLPLPFFHKKRTTTSNADNDIESQPQSYTSARRISAPSANPHHFLDATQRTIETSIGSGPTTSHSAHHDEDSIDPLSLKLGSRAYRERERRESDGLKEKEGKKERSRVVADEVVVSTALDRKEEINRADD